MKIVFSRKGFDSGYGGVPSPVLPGIGPLSLPIPSPAGAAAGLYRVAGLPLADLLSHLTGGKHDGSTLVHFDPDLDASSRERRAQWRAALGQVGAAQSHLANCAVGVGDLFLFFGWFRPAEWADGLWRFVPGSASFHALFGWLQVGAVIEVPTSDTSHVPASLRDHPHVAHASRFREQGNTIYVAGDRLKLLARGSDLAGAGRLDRWTNALRLSVEGSTRSVWDVPTWLDPRPGRTALTYHGSPDRWHRVGERLQLRTVAKGQEFVLDCDEYPEASSWAWALIKRHALPVRESEKVDQ